MMSMKDKLICGRMRKQKRVSRLVKLRRRKEKLGLLKLRQKKPKFLVKRQKR